MHCYYCTLHCILCTATIVNYNQHLCHKGKVGINISISVLARNVWSDSCAYGLIKKKIKSFAKELLPVVMSFGWETHRYK